MKIERVNASNVDAVAKLHIKAEQQTYGIDDPEMIAGNSEFAGRRNIWDVALRNNCNAFLIYDDCVDYPIGMISGYLNFKHSLEARHAKLSCIYVLKEFQRAGNGRRLLSTFVETILRSNLEELRSVVPVNNKSARNFFSSMGGFEHDIHQIRLGNEYNTRKFVNIIWSNASCVLNLV